MEVAPFFVNFYHFLSIFTISYWFSRFTHFCRDLHFVAIYALFPQFFFGQNSLFRNITRFLHVWVSSRLGWLLELLTELKMSLTIMTPCSHCSRVYKRKDGLETHFSHAHRFFVKCLFFNFNYHYKIIIIIMIIIIIYYPLLPRTQVLCQMFFSSNLIVIIIILHAHRFFVKFSSFFLQGHHWSRRIM